VAIDASGNLYVADSANNRIVMVNPAGAGSAIDLGGLTLSAPRGVAIDAAGNLYISDSGNNRIVKLPSGGSAAVLSITGLGTALNVPAGLGVDAAGRLYIADAGNNRIVMVSGVAGSALSISGLGTALSAPTGVSVDSFGNVFIADSGNNRVVRVSSSGTASVPSTGSLSLNLPLAATVDVHGVVYVADTANSRIVSLMMSAVSFGELQVGASSGNSITLPFTIGIGTTLGSVQALTLGAPGLDFTLGSGTTCANGTIDADCNIEVQFLPLAAGSRRGAVALFDESNTLLAVVPIYGSGGGAVAALSPGTASAISTGGVSLGSPFAAAIDGAGNIYVANYTGNNVVKIAAGGGSAAVVNTGGLTLNEAAGVAVDGAGNLYIADYGHDRIVLVTSSGTASVLNISGLGTAINQPAALAIDEAGNLYIADWGNSRIVKATPTGAGQVVNTGSYSLSGSGVTGVAVDASGNVYIADRASNHIVKVAASGAASLVSLTGLTLSNPQGVAVDSNGNLYIADSGHRRVVQLTVSGAASVVQTPGQTLGTILYGVMTDAGGNIYAVDWSNNRLSKVTVGGAALSFANTPVGATSSDSPKTAAVTNMGNQALTFSANPSYTANFSKNSSDADLCAASTSLNPGETCDVSVMFTPQSAGSLSASVVVTNNHLNGTDATQNVAVSGTGVTPITPTITWTQPSAIVYGTTLSGILNATATDGESTVAGSFAYTATRQGGSANAVTSATVLAAGSYTLSVTFTPDSSSYTAATGSVSLTVGKAAPTVALQSSGSPALVSNSVLFTATVSASASTPSGAVNFYDATTLLGSGTLASGRATYTNSSLSAGTHAITATYTGDANFSSATSSAVSQVVSDLSMGVASGGSSSATVSAGGTATYHLTIGPSDGSTLPAAVTLTATGGPTGSTITISPESIAAGAEATDVTLTVHVPGASAAVHKSHAWVLAFALPFMGILALPLSEIRRRSLKGGLFCFLLLLVVAFTVTIAGCGNSSHPAPAQPSNYTITVTATSGSVSHSTALTLRVQ
jgi:sugar lactone lactonase YvrE